MTTPITLQSLETESYTKKQIQDENVRNGLARCENELRPTNIQNGHLWCPVLYDLSALRPCDTIKNGHKVPIFNVHGSIQIEVHGFSWRGV
jgi:hypothetical protein